MENEIIESKANSVIDAPVPTKETRPKERGFGLQDLYLTRFVPPWSRPPSMPAVVWRAWVANQPVATDCREFLTTKILSLDWKITPRNSDYREELQGTIKYYTDLFAKGGKYDELGLDWTGLIEWVVGDLLDLPFGAAIELGRKNDSPDGRVVWLRPLDGGTLYPTLNKNFPVLQYVNGWEIVNFPQHAVARMFMSPVQNIWREGWGVAPPEKLYFAIEMLNRGDKYYGNLLLDIPALGILDLGDMSQDAAQEWINSFRTFVTDTTASFKVPVLYEHNTKTEYIPLTQRPDQIMFDKITHKYAALICAAYGVTPADINLSTTTASGETLAGAIRSERHTKGTGLARVKSKVKYLLDRVLPPSLEFSFIDYDTEDMVNLGRARLANSQAFKTYKEMGTFSNQELRSQIIQDGQFTISIPDEIPPEAEELQPFSANPFGNKPKTGGNKEPELTGNKVSPSQGGEGEFKSITFKSRGKVTKLPELVNAIVNRIAPQIIDSVSTTHEDELLLSQNLVTRDIFSSEDLFGIGSTLNDFAKPVALFRYEIDALQAEIRDLLGGDENLVISPVLEGLAEELNAAQAELDFVRHA